MRGVGWLLVFLGMQVGIAVVLKIAAAYPPWRVGGTVLAAALLIVTQARPSPAQFIGVALTAVGLFLLALGTPPA